MPQLIELDHNLFFSINNGWQNPFFDVLMPLATQLGNAWVVGLIVIPILYLTDKKHFIRNLSLFAAVMAVTGILGKVVKLLVDRPRPLTDMAALVESHRVYIHVIGDHLREYSFPSGHALTAFSAATFLSFEYKRLTPVFFSVAIMTGLSRIYMGVHFPLDVAAGAVLATVATGFMCYWIRKYYFKN